MIGPKNGEGAYTNGREGGGGYLGPVEVDRHKPEFVSSSVVDLCHLLKKQVCRCREGTPLGTPVHYHLDNSQILDFFVFFAPKKIKIIIEVYYGSVMQIFADLLHL